MVPTRLVGLALGVLLLPVACQGAATTEGRPRQIGHLENALSHPTPGPALASPAEATQLRQAALADYPAATVLPNATVYAQSAAQVEDLSWALDRFTAAGLVLPHVEAWIHDDRSGCIVADGRQVSGYQPTRNETHVVFSCGNRHTLLHELAHVWERRNMEDGDRNRFLALRGVAEWVAPEWRLSGREHLAVVIAWALDPQHPRPMRTQPNDDSSMAEAYALVTSIGRDLRMGSQALVVSPPQP